MRGKSWNFYWKISRIQKVLEIYLQGPGKSWNLLGNDADGKRSDADIGTKVWHKPVLTYAIRVFTLLILVASVNVHVHTFLIHIVLLSYYMNIYG